MIYKFIWLFFIYSFIGWIMEVIVYLYQYHKLINRGFFLGPYCPIYGVGGVLITLLLKPYANDIVVLFVMTIVICSILEYFTSYIMEKLFKTRWWDYSNQKYNLNGRICLETMIPFGLIGCFTIYLLNPFLMHIINFLPIIVVKIVAIILVILFIIDNIVSFGIISNLKLAAINVRKDNTEEITKKVKEALKLKNSFTKRLVDAFPNFKVLKSFNFRKIKEAKNEIRKEKKKISKLEKEVKRNEKLLKKIK